MCDRTEGGRRLSQPADRDPADLTRCGRILDWFSGWQRCSILSVAPLALIAAGIDIGRGAPYFLAMRQIVRALLVALILAFAAGTVVQASRAVAMDMAMAGMSATMSMQGCDDCNGGETDHPGDSMASCFAMCIAPAFALPPQYEASAPAGLLALPVGFGTPVLAGRTGSPDPYPPRTIVLS